MHIKSLHNRLHIYCMYMSYVGLHECEIHVLLKCEYIYISHTWCWQMTNVGLFAVTWRFRVRMFCVYLLLNSVSLSHHGVEIVTFGNAVDHQLPDLHLQVCVGAFQWTHLEDRQTHQRVSACCWTGPEQCSLVSCVAPCPGSWPDGCWDSAWPPCHWRCCRARRSAAGSLARWGPG